MHCSLLTLDNVFENPVIPLRITGGSFNLTLIQKVGPRLHFE